MNQDQDFLGKLQALKVMFGQGLPGRLQDLDAVMQQCMEDPGCDAHLAALYRLLNTLAGSAGTFGFPELGEQARRIEDHVTGLLARDKRSADDLAQIARALPALQAWLPLPAGRSPAK